MDEIIQSTERERRKESYVNNTSYTSPFAACLYPRRGNSAASNATARYFSTSFITIARITRARAEIDTSHRSEANSASTMSAIVPLDPFQKGTREGPRIQAERACCDGPRNEAYPSGGDNHLATMRSD